MGNSLDYAPVAAAAFAIPQFLPQIRKLRRTDDTAGVSWPWATLTSVNNGAWVVYFALSAYCGVGRSTPEPCRRAGQRSTGSNSSALRWSSWVGLV